MILLFPAVSHLCSNDCPNIFSDVPTFLALSERYPKFFPYLSQMCPRFIPLGQPSPWLRQIPSSMSEPRSSVVPTVSTFKKLPSVVPNVPTFTELSSVVSAVKSFTKFLSVYLAVPIFETLSQLPRLQIRPVLKFDCTFPAVPISTLSQLQQIRLIFVFNYPKNFVDKSLTFLRVHKLILKSKITIFYSLFLVKFSILSEIRSANIFFINPYGRWWLVLYLVPLFIWRINSTIFLSLNSSVSISFWRLKNAPRGSSLTERSSTIWSSDRRTAVGQREEQ